MSGDWKVLWLDLETGGLDAKLHGILEIYARMTRADPGDVVGEFHAVIGMPDLVPVLMDDYALKKHSETGLMDEVAASKRNLGDVGDDFAAWLTAFGGRREIYLAGSSIHFDRGFIREAWPAVDEYLHYRMIDVSALIIARNAQRGLRPDFGFPPKEVRAHRAREDVDMSIALYHGIEFAAVDNRHLVDVVAAHDAMFRHLHPDLDPRDSRQAQAVRAAMEKCATVRLDDGRHVTIVDGRITEVP